MTFVTDARAYPLITKAREGLSFAQVAAEVGVNVLNNSLSFGADQQLDQVRGGKKRMSI